MNVISDDDIDFSQYMQESEPRQMVRRASDYVADMVSSLGKPRQNVGCPLPWLKVRNEFRFRPGEVTIWAGVNGHGKSLMTGMQALNFVSNRKRSCIASFEMKPPMTLKRMMRQWVGFETDREDMDTRELEIAREVYEQFGDLSNDRLWFYDRQGTVQWEQVCAVARYCFKELGMHHFFVDSLMKCVRGEDDYNGQKAFVDELTAIARDHDGHIHLIHHMRKLENELKMPDKTDLKGTGAISDQVDNILLVWRNKDTKARDEKTPDARLICCKQRNGEWEGGVNLWFHRESQQFLGEFNGNIIDYASEAM